jgi:hypothetical protein
MSATLLKISYAITSDDFYGLPWPPPDRDVFWVIVRRADGRTLWRSIQLAQVRPAATDFCNFRQAATEMKGSQHD